MLFLASLDKLKLDLYFLIQPKNQITKLFPYYYFYNEIDTSPIIIHLLIEVVSPTFCLSNDRNLILMKCRYDQSIGYVANILNSIWQYGDRGDVIYSYVIQQNVLRICQ